MTNGFWSPKVSFYIISFITTLLITKTGTTTMERRNRRRWEEEQEEKTTGWLIMPPGMFFFRLYFFLLYSFVLPQMDVLYTKQHPFLHQAPVFTPTARFLHQLPVFLPHLHSATRATLSKGHKQRNSVSLFEPGVSFFIYFMYSMIFTSLSRTAYGPFSTPSSPFMYQPPVFCTNRPFFLYQPPVFYPICTQLPRLPFPRGPNDETEFRRVCPRLEMHLRRILSPG